MGAGVAAYVVGAGGRAAKYYYGEGRHCGKV